MWGGAEREQCCLLRSLLVFSHFPRYPQSNWALLVLILSGWVCVPSRTQWVSPMSSPVRLGVSPTATLTPTGVFSQRFEALFPCNGTLSCAVCLAPQFFLPQLICPRMWDCPDHDLPPHRVLQPLPCCKSSPHGWLPVSTPPTRLMFLL